MAKSSNTGAIVILAILALGGLGLSGYMFIMDQFFAEEEYQLIAIWDELHGLGDNFDIELEGLKTFKEGYFTLSPDNTTIELTQAGWYRFTVRTTFISLTVTDRYFMQLRKNTVTIHTLAYENFPTDTTSIIDTVAYVQSDGDDAFTFNCYSLGADLLEIAINQNYNQIALDYIG